MVTKWKPKKCFLSSTSKTNRFVFFNETSDNDESETIIVYKNKRPEKKQEGLADQRKEDVEKVPVSEEDKEKEVLDKQNKPPIPEYDEAKEGKRKGASELIAEIKDKPINEQIAILKEQVKKGNIPPFMRQFKEVTIERNGISITLSVAPQYLAVGSEHDWAFIPMNGVDAMDIAQSLDCSLPTDVIVRNIEKKADIVAFTDARELGKTIIDPESGQPLFVRWAKGEKGEVYGKYEGDNMQSTDMWVKSSDTVKDIMGEHPQDLTAGYKKDMVLDPKVIGGLEVIYGGKHPNGKRVQKASDYHEDTYPDYSQGLRLVRNSITIKEKQYDPKTKQFIMVTKTMPYEKALGIIKYARLLSKQVLPNAGKMYRKVPAPNKPVNPLTPIS